jgi:hypothetical protein
MGQALLSADRLSGSASVSPSADQILNTPTRGKTPQILTYPKAHLSEARALLRKHAKAVIYEAFSGERSRYAVCLKAAQTFGCSPDKIEAIIEGETANPCPLILGMCAGIVRKRTGKPTPICKPLAQIFAFEVPA